MSQTQSSCSQLALHLSKNQAIRPCRRGVFLSGEAGTYSRRFGLSTTFFRSPKLFSECHPVSLQAVQKREVSPFCQACQQFFSSFPSFFQTRNRSLPFVFQLPGGLSDCPIRSILSTTCFSESKKRTASLPASLGGAFLQPELPFRSGEVALWPFHHLLSTLFPIFFKNLVSPFGHINFIHI